MDTNSAFNFSVDKEHKVIYVKREFAANLELVWDAWTKSDYVTIKYDSLADRGICRLLDRRC